ncbi:MAG TPA: hypothetical protein VFT79_11440 [Solirubrobacterales bacterium]|nr:hypothetical protein [Solirubrobacterales bacterium]
MSDRILEAKTVGQFMAAVNEVYGRDIPTSFGPGTELEQIWEAEIKVSKEPSPGVLYQANGTTTLSIDVLTGTVCVSVEAPSSKEAQWQRKQPKDGARARRPRREVRRRPR